MRKNIKLYLVFALILMVTISGIQFGIDRYYRKKSAHKFTSLMKHELDAEVMIFGSSVAYQDFDPRVIREVTGKTAYNVGWDGVFFEQYNALIKEYLTYQKKCKYMIITCDFENLHRHTLISRPDLFLAFIDNNYIYDALSQIEPRKAFCARYLPGYKLTTLNKSFYKDIAFARPDTDNLFGFGPSAEPWKKNTEAKAGNAGYEEQTFLQLKSTIDLVTQKGIKVVLVMTPMYEAGYKLVSNAGWFRDKYKTLAGNNVYFLDYMSDSICSMQNNFHNYGHLNKDGANLFSHALAKDLQKIVGDENMVRL